MVAQISANVKPNSNIRWLARGSGRTSRLMYVLVEESTEAGLVLKLPLIALIVAWFRSLGPVIQNYGGQ